MVATNTELIAVFTEDGIKLDIDFTRAKQFYAGTELLQDFKVESSQTLLRFGFADKPEYLSPTMEFVYSITSLFASRLSRAPDIKITRQAKTMTPEDADLLLMALPFATGSEFANYEWLDKSLDRSG